MKIKNKKTLLLHDIKRHSKNWRKEKANLYKTYIRTSAVGLEVCISLLICVILGFLLDRWLKIEPICIIFGILIGFIASGRILYKFSKNYICKNIKLKNELKNESKGSGD